MDLAARAFAAHADAWEARGRIRADAGGDVGAVRGMRLMVSGLRQPQWDAADVLASDPDIGAARAWYAARGVDRLDARVPVSLDWRCGRHLFRKPLMALAPAGFRTAPRPAGSRSAQPLPATWMPSWRSTPTRMSTTTSRSAAHGRRRAWRTPGR